MVTSLLSDYCRSNAPAKPRWASAAVRMPRTCRPPAASAGC